MRTALRVPPLVLVFAVGLGLVAWAADRVSADSAFPLASGLGNLPSHWLGTAFLIGAIARQKLTGALFATLGLALAVAVYYTAIRIAGDRPDANLGTAARAWLVVALVAGPVFGAAGAAWLSGPQIARPWAVALLSGALAGEAIYLADRMNMLAGFSLSHTPTMFVVLELITAACLPFIMLREARDRLLAFAFATMCALVMAAATAFVIEYVRELLTYS